MWDEGQSRGFAFISYSDKAAVEKAIEKLDGNTSMSYDDCYMSVKKAVDHEEATRAREKRQAENATSKEATHVPNHKGRSEGKQKHWQQQDAEPQEEAEEAEEPEEPEAPEEPVENPHRLAAAVVGALVESTGKKVVFDSDSSDDEE